MSAAVRSHSFILSSTVILPGGTAIPILLAASAMIACSSARSTHEKGELDRIFSADTFYVTRIQFFGFFPVMDSISFMRNGPNSIGHLQRLSPWDPDADMTKGLDQSDLFAIRQVLDRRPGLLTRSSTYAFISVFDNTDTVVIADWDRQQPMINDIKEVFKGK